MKTQKDILHMLEDLIREANYTKKMRLELIRSLNTGFRLEREEAVKSIKDSPLPEDLRWEKLKEFFNITEKDLEEEKG